MPELPESQSRMSVESAALYLGLSVSFLNRRRVIGGGPTYTKLGRRVVYAKSDLDAWLALHRRNSTSAMNVAA